MTAQEHPRGGVLQEEERLALLSALHALTVAAMRLFDGNGNGSLSHFMERVAERLECAAALCVELDAATGRLELLGSAGLSRESAELPVHIGHALRPITSLSELPLPYPELPPELPRWFIPIGEGEGSRRRGLMLFFFGAPRLQRELKGVAIRLAGILDTVFEYRALLAVEQNARARAEEAVAARDEFLSTAAHELRIPITRLSLRVDALARCLESGRALPTDTVKKLRDSMKTLSNLISDLLDISRSQVGRLQLSRERRRLDLLVREVVDSFTPMSSLHRFELRADGEVWVSADPVRMEQVVGNLLENAIKYSPGGGTIRVRLFQRAGLAVIAVSDQGIGVPAEQRQALFDRFFRASNAQRGRFSGTGLGLYITRDIVQQHGGRIWFDSQLGRGSTFYVTLPTDERVAEARDRDSEARLY